ncbi:hypothetical protein EU96_2038 [Prochlorococcus marinus str. MIT 9302]|uniref:Uncharacterized protein n=1 Tax=Prochlorococcus marinus str. MIT 9302 TaxID=74545 RepID=A0A0A2A713_PROMR|nr:hypothetical protein EU96_2038 [Prochlorococcus marinus str. MIT 9302]
MNNAKKNIFAQKKILNHPTVIMQPFIQNFFINFLFVQSLFKQLGLNKGILMKWQKDLVKKI